MSGQTVRPTKKASNAFVPYRGHMNAERSQALLQTFSESFGEKNRQLKKEQKQKCYAPIIAVPHEWLCRLFAIFYWYCTAVVHLDVR